MKESRFGPGRKCRGGVWDRRLCCNVLMRLVYEERKGLIL